MRVLGGVDAAFLHLETPDTPMHVASILERCLAGLFMPRRSGDRPPAVPSALAVRTLLGVPQAVPPAWQGLEHPNALVGAIRRILE